MSYIFLLGDADDVGKRLQGFLISGDLGALKALSSALSASIAELGFKIKEDFAAEIVFCGGDELLAHIDSNAFDESRLRELMVSFAASTGVTISFGVGRNTREAFLNLTMAKSAGPGSIFSNHSG